MQLRSSGQPNKKGKRDWLPVLGGAVLGTGWFILFCSAFGLRWSPAQAFSGSPLQGLLSVCNAAADHLGRSDYILLKKYAGGVTAGGDPAAQGFFLTILLVLLCLLSWMILRSGCRWLLLIPAAPAAALMLFTHAAPGIWAGAGFAFALVCAFALMSVGRTASPWLLAVPLLALALCIGAAAVMDQGGGFARTGLQEKTGAALDELAAKRYGENPLGSGRLAELDGGKLAGARGSMADPASAMGEGDRTKTAMEVTMSRPEPMYLRGFIGEIYTGKGWSSLSDSTLYDQRDALYWLNRQGFDGLSQLSEAAAAAGEAGEAQSVQIAVKSANRAQIYTPYEITGTDAAVPEGTKNCAGGFLRTDRFTGTRTCSYQVIPGLSASWTDWAGRLYSAGDSRALQEYFASESHYNVWCYASFTGIPGAMAGLLQAAVGSPGDLSDSHADYKETIASIRTYLEDNYLYTENFTAPEAGEDAVEHFMVTGRGCDAHYASLAALLFRYYGIPARYVEGYLVTPEDTEGAKATRPVAIGASHAHAWTEIYIDGLGWIPVEMTGVYRDIMPEADMEKGLQAVQYAAAKQDREDPPEEELSEEQGESSYGRLLLRILLTAAGLLLALLLLWIAYRLIGDHREKRARLRSFADPDPRKGVCAMYGHLLREGIPCTGEAEEIGDRASFSREEIDENDRTRMRVEMEWGEREKKAQEKRNHRTAADRLSAVWRWLRRK
ncbi:MAG: transglutaminase domain-containing protein [Firmicutes bacterium]|nr:transglutaminase domain-containing protein [Bacillota bacterium]